MRIKLSILFSAVLFLLVGCYQKDIDEINSRLDSIENNTIASINKQISSISSSISSLESMDFQLKSLITSLQGELSEVSAAIEDLKKKDTDIDGEINKLNQKASALEAAIAKLEDKDIELEGKISDLKSYVDTELSSAKDWVSATFATLEQYNSLVSELETLRTLLKTSIDELEGKINKKMAEDILAAISTSESTMKSWVNERLAGYYTIAEVDSKLQSLRSDLSEEDAELDKKITALEEDLINAKTELTEAYMAAIKSAIETNNGLIDSKIASEIESVNNRINDEVKKLSDRLDDIEDRLADLENKLRSLDITFDVDGSAAFSPGETITINYTLANADESTTVESMAEGTWSTKVTMSSFDKGSIEIKTSASSDSGKVLVFVNRGTTMIMRTLLFEKGVLTILEDSYTVEPEGGVVEINAKTNVAYDVIIPDEDQSWISITPSTKATMRDEIISLTIGTNPYSKSRSSVIKILDKAGSLLTQLSILQLSDIQSDNEIWYTTYSGEAMDVDINKFSASVISNTYTKGRGVIRFSDDVLEIPNNVFNESNNLRSISIPNSVKTIGNNAFRDCYNLEQVYFSESLVEIGNYAFFNCKSLTSIILANSVKYIGDSAFAFCEKLSCLQLGGCLVEIGSYAFQNCLKLQGDLYIPESVSRIGTGAFGACISLSSVRIMGGVSYLSNTFYTCSSLKYAYVYGASTEMSGTFNDCGSLEYVEMEGTFSEMRVAFNDCKQLKSILLAKDVQAIYDGNFKGCSSLALFEGQNPYVFSYGHSLLDKKGLLIYAAAAGLEEYYVPSNCSGLSSRCIEEKSGLSRVVVLNGTKTIASEAFYACQDLTSITFPSSLVSVSNDFIRKCDKLSEVYCTSTTAPIIGSSSFRYFVGNGTFHYPKGSDYQTWIDALSPLGWTCVDDL